METEEKHKLVIDNMRYVYSMARKYGNPMNLEDLQQEGFLALTLAAEKFDPSRNFTFLTYAHHWIIKQMFSYLKKESKYIPTDLQDITREAENIGVELQPHEVVAELNNITEQVNKTLLNREITARDLDIIKCRYLSPNPATLQELGDKYNISRQRVNQIEQYWTAKVKKDLNL
jgi:RNA polymerase sigma factor (sigma-70 family)